MSTNKRMPDKMRIDTEDLQSMRGTYVGEDIYPNMTGYAIKYIVF